MRSEDWEHKSAKQLKQTTDLLGQLRSDKNNFKTSSRNM